MHRKDAVRVLDMTHGKTISLLLRFSLPLFLGNLLQQLYNLADTSIAGNLLGDAALAQIGATAALYSLIINAAFGLNNGLGLSVSRSFGAGDEKRMRQSVSWMVELSMLSALVLTAAFLLLRKGIVSALQIPADTVEGALRYLTVILAGIPFSMLYNLESALLQAVGNSVVPLLFLLFSSLLNVGLDLLFMGPLAMGVQGAAIATILSQGVSALLSGIYILKNYPELRFSKDDHASGRKYASGMLWAGVSMALMSAIYNIGSVVLQGSINALGNVYIAAQVGARRLAEFFYMPGGSLATAMATFASQNFGAGKRADRRGRPQRHFALRCMVARGAGVHISRSARCRPRDHGQRQRRGDRKRRAVSPDQHPHDPADGGARDTAQHTAGHAAYGRAAPLQLAGADRKGHLRAVDRPCAGVYGGVRL